MDTLNCLCKYKVVTVVRRLYGDDLLRLAHALHDGGVRLMECAFDQQDSACVEKTTEAIRSLRREMGEEMRFGAGTVLNRTQLEAAAAAGAEYIVSPNVNEKVITRTKELGLVSVPGALTPTEILSAHDMGADVVKLFPAMALGFSYIKDIMTPISHVKLMAAGGVNEENFSRFLSMGFVGAGISGRLTDKELIARGDYAELTRRAAAFMKLAEN